MIRRRYIALNTLALHMLSFCWPAVDGLSLAWFGVEGQGLQPKSRVPPRGRCCGKVVLRPAIAKACDDVHLLLVPEQLAHEMSTKSAGQWCPPTATGPKRHQAGCAASIGSQ